MGMRIMLLTAGVVAAALALPVAAGAQQAQYPAGQAQQSQGSQGTTPSPSEIQRRVMKRLGHLNLSNDQQQRIQSMINQFSQQHPEGSPRDRAAARELRRQIMGVLTTDQQNQLRQEMQAHHEQMQQRNQQYQQGQSPNQGQPPNQVQPPNEGQPPNQAPPPPH